MKNLLAIALIAVSTSVFAQTYQNPYYRSQQPINSPMGTTMGAQRPSGDTYYQGAAPQVNTLSPGGGHSVDTQPYYIQPNGTMGTQQPAPVYNQYPTQRTW